VSTVLLVFVAECTGPEKDGGNRLLAAADQTSTQVTITRDTTTRAASEEVSFECSSASVCASASVSASVSRTELASEIASVVVTTASLLSVSSENVSTCTRSASAPASRRPSLGRGQAPCFVKTLPSRVELLEGAQFNCMAKVGRGGCAPWFVRPLPSTFEIEQGKSIESKCFIGDAFEEEINATKREQAEQAPKLRKMEGSPRSRFMFDVYANILFGVCFLRLLKGSPRTYFTHLFDMFHVQCLFYRVI
jgi:hypothetical protein